MTGANRFNTDGLNSLKYKILELKAKPLYTWILVEITPESVSCIFLAKLLTNFFGFLNFSINFLFILSFLKIFYGYFELFDNFIGFFKLF